MANIQNDTAKNITTINSTDAMLDSLTTLPPTSITDDTTLIDNSTDIQPYTINIQMTVLKSVDKVSASVGDTLSYTLSILNNTDLKATYTLLQETLNTNLTLVENSIKINGDTTSDVFPLVLGEMEIGQTFVVTFDAIVTNTSLLESIPNTFTFNYIMKDTSGSTYSSALTSNLVSTAIVPRLGLNFLKFVDKEFAQTGETLTYSFTAENTSDYNYTDILFKDNPPQGTNFIDGSVIINGTSYADYSPLTGFKLPDISSMTTISISFNVLVM